MASSAKARALRTLLFPEAVGPMSTVMGPLTCSQPSFGAVECCQWWYSESVCVARMLRKLDTLKERSLMVARLQAS